MCGRTRVTLGEDQVLRAAGARRWVDREAYRPSYNAAPGFAAPVVRYEGGGGGGGGADAGGGEPVVQTMRWGLVPSFTKPGDKPDFWRMFNARSETLAEKPSFRRLVPGRRCLVLAEGFFEWHKQGKGKQPYYVHLAGGEPLVMAGLWDEWRSADGPMHSFTILTTDASPRLEWLHDRMPVILRDTAAQQRWLRTDDKAGVGTLHKLYSPYNGDDLVWHAVTPAVGSVAFQGPDCVKELKKPSIASFFKPRASPAKAPAQQAAAKPEAAVKQERAAEINPGVAVKREAGFGQGAAAWAAGRAAGVKPEPEELAAGGDRPQQPQAGANAAAVNADEQPADRDCAAAQAAAGQRAVEQPAAATPRKRQHGGGGVPGGGGSKGGGGSAAKKAKLPGQLGIAQFFGGGGKK